MKKILIIGSIAAVSILLLASITVSAVPSPVHLIKNFQQKQKVHTQINWYPYQFLFFLNLLLLSFLEIVGILSNCLS